MDERSFVLLAISKFEEKAFEVIKSMADHFKLDLSAQHPFLELQSRKTELWKGQFNDWNYRFHGSSCEFIHLRTKEFLDVKTIHGNNFGAIDHFFLFRFTETSIELKHLNFQINESRFYEIIDQLKEDGKLINTGDARFPVWILEKTTRG